MKQKYIVVLRSEQRQYLENLTSSGTLPVRQMKRAQILLKSDQRFNWSYTQIADAFDVSQVTIVTVRKTFAEEGFEAALHRKKPERDYAHALDGEGEAHLIALACSEPSRCRRHRARCWRRSWPRPDRDRRKETAPSNEARIQAAWHRRRSNWSGPRGRGRGR